MVFQSSIRCTSSDDVIGSCPSVVLLVRVCLRAHAQSWYRHPSNPVFLPGILVLVVRRFDLTLGEVHVVDCILGLSLFVLVGNDIRDGSVCLVDFVSTAGLLVSVTSGLGAARQIKAVDFVRALQAV